METRPTTSRDNTNRAGWWVVLGSSVGVGLGSLIVVNASFPLLSRAAMGEFGSTQVEIVRAVTLFLAFQMVMSPVAGILLDRIGTRPVALGSIALFGVSLGILAFAHNLIEYCAAFAFMGLVSAPTNFVSYARAISTWFEDQRGFALGLAASAQGIGAGLVPLVAGWALSRGGWQSAVWIFAGIEILFCLPIVALLVRERGPDAPSRGPNANAPHSEQTILTPMPGLTITEILKTWVFWALIACFALSGFTFYAIILNIGAVVAQIAAMDIGHVAIMQTVLGLSAIPGRIASGYFLDRMRGYLVAVSVTLLTVVALLLYVISRSFASFTIAALLLGFSGGSENNLMPFFAGRIFGLKSVSKVYGWFLLSFFVGALIGPMAFAEVGALLHSYLPGLWGLAAIQIIITWLFYSMRSWRDHDENTNAKANDPNFQIQTATPADVG